MLKRFEQNWPVPRHKIWHRRWHRTDAHLAGAHGPRHRPRMWLRIPIPFRHCRTVWIRAHAVFLIAIRSPSASTPPKSKRRLRRKRRRSSGAPVRSMRDMLHSSHRGQTYLRVIEDMPSHSAAGPISRSDNSANAAPPALSSRKPRHLRDIAAAWSQTTRRSTRHSRLAITNHHRPQCA